MISIMMFLYSLAMQRHIEQRPQADVHQAVMSVSALADGMAYYQSQAIAHCWNSNQSICAAGPVNLQNRIGSQAAVSYGSGSGYETTTDGSTYIMTTLARQGGIAGRSTQMSEVNSGVFAALKTMTDASKTVGYYDQTAGGIIIPERGNMIVQAQFAAQPVQGQPVLYSSIATASPPAQLASIDGGGYSPVVPISAPVSPTASPTPEAIVSPPAAVSPPEAVSPTYAPPATVVISPISPWAPSPVPPPPPPPVPPPPPPPPPVPPSGWNTATLSWSLAGLGNVPSYTYTLQTDTGITVSRRCYFTFGGGGRGGATLGGIYSQNPNPGGYAYTSAYNGNVMWTIATSEVTIHQVLDMCAEMTPLLTQYGTITNGSGPDIITYSQIKTAGTMEVSYTDAMSRTVSVPKYLNTPMAIGITNMADIITIFANGILPTTTSTLKQG